MAVKKLKFRLNENLSGNILVKVLHPEGVEKLGFKVLQSIS